MIVVMTLAFWGGDVRRSSLFASGSLGRGYGVRRKIIPSICDEWHSLGTYNSEPERFPAVWLKQLDPNLKSNLTGQVSQ